MKKGSSDAGSRRGSKLGRIMKAPLRVLCLARDLYVSSLTGLAEKASCRSVVGYPGAASAGVVGSHLFYLPRVGGTGEDDLRELMRAASRGGGGGGTLGLGRRAVGGSGVAPRSQSVGMARIDEDGPCDFCGEGTVVGELCPRRRSCEVPEVKRRVGVMG